MEDKVSKLKEWIKEKKNYKETEKGTAWTKVWLRRQQMVHEPREQTNHVKEEEIANKRKEEKELRYQYLRLCHGENESYMS